MSRVTDAVNTRAPPGGPEKQREDAIRLARTQSSAILGSRTLSITGQISFPIRWSVLSAVSPSGAGFGCRCVVPGETLKSGARYSMTFPLPASSIVPPILP